MNQPRSTAHENLEGSMFLYTQPQLLTVEDHGHLGLNTSGQPYDFVRSIRVVPLAAAELSSAQKNYPVVFSDLEKPALLAVVGVLEDRNLFVDDNGNWDSAAYVPSYLRCYPFAMSTRQDDQYAVVIDRVAPVISENPDQPFFDGQALTAPIQAQVDLCAQFAAHQPATQAFCDRLVELELLSGQQATFTPEGEGEEQTIASYVAVDFDKLRKLDATTVEKLFQDGMLAAIYAHGFSLENWFQLLKRRQHLSPAQVTDN
jgi:hypothetical protein